jgi:3-dehydro-L-gulonate 2-dehydrogenase
MRIPYQEMINTFAIILAKHDFSPERAQKCAVLFAKSSLDVVASHGLNRFPQFLEMVKDGWVYPDAEPEREFGIPAFERWNGHLGPGMLHAEFCMDRAIKMAKDNGVGCVALNNTNHWMRGGNYGWQAASAGCIGICFTNTIPNMPAWGGSEPKLGNNPLVIAAPYKDEAVVLDMAMTQYSYGKMSAYLNKKSSMPYEAGFDEKGALTKNPAEVLALQLALPAGLWKGAGLSLMLDMIASVFSKGKATHQIGENGIEFGVSQFFCCLDMERCGLDKEKVDQHIRYILE